MRTRLLRLGFWSAGLAFCLWFWWSLIGILSGWFCCGVLS
jgi:hypothetical protein